MTRRGLGRALLGLAALSPGCEPDGPVEPAWGKQPCAACAMVLSDRQAAAQLVAASGERRHFDDLGCMAAHLQGQPLPARAWVRGASGGWVEARSARYRTGARTPMDYGFLPSDGGEASWDDVARTVEQKGAQRP